MNYQNVFLYVGERPNRNDYGKIKYSHLEAAAPTIIEHDVLMGQNRTLINQMRIVCNIACAFSWTVEFSWNFITMAM